MSIASLQSVIRVDDPALESATRDRALALDGWLSEVHPSAWAELKRAWRLPSVEASPVRDLWAFFLVATEVARAATSGRGGTPASIVEGLVHSPIEVCEPVRVPGGGQISLPCDHGVIRSDLRTVAQPEISGAVLSGLPRAAIADSLRAVVDKALSLVSSTSNELLELVRFHCGAVALIDVEPTLERNTCVSLTSKLIPGLVYVTPVPPILMAESIVHECAHLCLTCHERRADLYVNAATRIMTPLRSDPRPISGLMHQVWVLAHLTRLYRALLTSSSDAVARNLRPVQNRLALHENGLRQGIATLSAVSVELTADGVLLAEALGSAVESR